MYHYLDTGQFRGGRRHWHTSVSPAIELVRYVHFTLSAERGTVVSDRSGTFASIIRAPLYSMHVPMV